MRCRNLQFPLYGSGLLLLVAALLCILPTPTDAATLCSGGTPLNANSEINIALPMWLIGQKQGLFTGDITTTQATAIPGYGMLLVQPSLLAVDLYVKTIRNQHGGRIKLAGGVDSVKVNFFYINLASDLGPLAADYSMTFSGLPFFQIQSTFPNDPFNAAGGYPPFPGSACAPGGLFEQITSLDPAVLQANFGITQPFTYIVPPVLLVDAPTVYLANLIENAQSHVLVHPFASSRELFVCDGNAPASSSTPDCLSPTYNRGRMEGARRFETMFGSILDSTTNQFAALDSFHTLGVKSVVILRDALDAQATFAFYAAQLAAEEAEQLNIKVLATFTTITEPNCDPTVAAANKVSVPVHCPPSTGLPIAQNQVYPNGQSPMDIARQIAELKPDAFIMLGQPTSNACWTMARVFDALKVVGFTPKAISWGGGLESNMPYFLTDVGDLENSWTTKPWDSRLKGPMYKNKGSATSFELFPANSTHDGPQVWADAYDAAYGPQANWGAAGAKGAHPMYDPNWQDYTVPAYTWGALMIMQKLIESSQTLHVPSILNAAHSVSSPSVFHQVQFDRYGRIQRVNEMLVQKKMTPGAKNVLIAPFNIGVAPVFPLPTWAERVFAPSFYSEPNEKVMIAINVLCLFLCVVLMVLVVVNYKAPVIRAATPSFCLVIVFGGIMLLISNFFNTLVVNDAHCAASAWFLTLGFTLMFASLFIKTFRIWRIFGTQKLTVLKMKDSELLMGLSVFILADVIINAAWQGAGGMKAIRVSTDPLRPSTDYLQCDYNDGIAAIYVHLITKGLLLLVGVALTWGVRNIPSQFNESSLIGMSIYNVSFVICFIVPIIAVGLGGRNTVYLIRNFAIMFVALTTLGLLYIPKLTSIMGGNGVSAVGTMNNNTAGGNNTHMDEENTNTPTGEVVQLSRKATRSNTNKPGGTVKTPKSGRINITTPGGEGTDSQAPLDLNTPASHGGAPEPSGSGEGSADQLLDTNPVASEVELGPVVPVRAPSGGWANTTNNTTLTVNTGTPSDKYATATSIPE